MCRRRSVRAHAFQCTSPKRRTKPKREKRNSTRPALSSIRANTNHVAINTCQFLTAMDLLLYHKRARSALINRLRFGQWAPREKRLEHKVISFRPRKSISSIRWSIYIYICYQLLNDQHIYKFIFIFRAPRKPNPLSKRPNGVCKQQIKKKYWKIVVCGRCLFSHQINGKLNPIRPTAERTRFTMAIRRLETVTHHCGD